MTLLGLLALVIAAVGVVRRHDRAIAIALGAGAGFPASAGVVVAGVTVPVFTCVALVAAGVWLMGRGPATRSLATGVLLAFVAWSTAVTVIGPWAFRGIPVLLPRLGVDQQIHSPSALAFSVSNLAQAAYLVSTAIAVLFLVRTGGAQTALLVAAWTGTTASAARDALRAVGADVVGPVVDTLDVAYAVVGDTRMRGVFAEPSELASFSLGVAAMATVLVATSHGRSRRGALVLAVLALVNLATSASGTAVVASGIVAAAMLVVLVVRFTGNGGRGTPWIVLGSIASAVAVLVAGSRLTAPMVAIVQDKIGSQSYDARTAADAIGLRVFTETWGFGAGLGSNRSSSFVVTLLSTVGVPGVMLFAVLVVVLVAGLRRGASLAAVTGLLAVLAAKSISIPDLSTPLLWLLIAASVLPTPVPPRDSGLSTGAHLRIRNVENSVRA